MAIREVEISAPVRPARPVGTPVSDMAQRLLDVCVSTTALFVLAPVLAVVALAILTDGQGQVIFRQVRIGRDMRPFTIYKFRTMTVNADDEPHRRDFLTQLAGDATPYDGGVAYKPRNDPRVTPVGRILRRYSLDELPQLLNVLKGDMATVGPRPSLVFEADAFPEWAESRFGVKPGITGPWQVAGRNELSIQEMLELDVRYAHQRTLRADLRILLRTIPAVLTARGAA